MMKKKFTAILLTVLLTMTMILAGCGADKEPKEALQAAAGKAMTMSSYQMESSFLLEELKIDAPSMGDESEIGMIVSLLKDAEITVNGVYKSEPMQTEMTLGVNLKGDMAINISVPMVMTQEMLYVKVPSIPLLPLPESVVGKYLAIDLKELAEESGQSLEQLDVEKSQKLSGELMNALFAEYDQESYFKKVDVKEAALPEGIEAEQLVKFQITNDNMHDAITILVNKVLPNVLDIVAKEEYRSLVGLTEEEIQEAKNEIQSGDQAELTEAIEELKKSLSINTFEVNTAINKDEFPVYQDLVLDLNIKDPESDENILIKAKGTNQYKNINQEQTFEIGIPEGDNLITMEQFEAEMDSYYGY